MGTRKKVRIKKPSNKSSSVFVTVKYCDICRRDIKEHEKGGKCQVCKKDLCQDHIVKSKGKTLCPECSSQCPGCGQVSNIKVRKKGNCPNCGYVIKN